MRQIIVFLLSLQFLTGNLFVREGMKLPMLWSHYQDHLQTEDAEMSFTRFIYLHYRDAEHQSSDTRHHDSLPLHGVCCITFVLSHPFEFPQIPKFQIPLYLSQLHDLCLPSDDLFIPYQVLFSVFHPPRI